LLCSAFCTADRFYIQTFSRLNLDPAIRPRTFLFCDIALFLFAGIYIHRGERLRLLYKLYRMRGQVFFIVSSASGISAWTRCSMKNINEKDCAPRVFGSTRAETAGVTRYLLYERCEHASHFSVCVLHSWLNEITRANTCMRITHGKISTNLNINSNLKILTCSHRIDFTFKYQIRIWKE